MSCRHLDAPATPTMLRIAPQLGVLAILDEALITAVCSLIAAHPALAAPAPGPDSTRHDLAARRLHDSLAHATHLLVDYRLAVAEMIADLDDASSPTAASVRDAF